MISNEIFLENPIFVPYRLAQFVIRHLQSTVFKSSFSLDLTTVFGISHWTAYGLLTCAYWNIILPSVPYVTNETLN